MFIILYFSLLFESSVFRTGSFYSFTVGCSLSYFKDSRHTPINIVYNIKLYFEQIQAAYFDCYFYCNSNNNNNKGAIDTQNVVSPRIKNRKSAPVK